MKNIPLSEVAFAILLVNLSHLKTFAKYAHIPEYLSNDLENKALN